MGEATEAVGRRYLRFARLEAPDRSPAYAALAEAVAADGPTLRFLAALPKPKQQPNLLFGVLKLLGAPVLDPAAALAWRAEHETAVRAEVLRRRTQTNEVRRCAVLSVALSRLPGPLALIEIGASAGLCLLPDAWGYRYRRPEGDVVLAPGTEPQLTCDVTGALELPTAVPRIAWRAGLDLNPLDPSDDDVRTWLKALIWPGMEEEREPLLSAALDVAASPPRIVRGDAVTDLAALLAEVPPGLTPVVQHSLALVYLDREDRTRVLETISAAGAHRVGLEAIAVLPHLAVPADLPPDPVGLSLDDDLLALADGHGRWLTGL